MGCVYKPPDSVLTEFISFLERMSPKINFAKSDVILLGDFNVDFSSTTRRNPAKRKLLNFMRSLDCSQLLDKPTRVTETSKSLIDLIFVNNEHRFTDSGIVPLSISDHSLIYCVLKVGKPKASPRTTEYRSFKTYDRDAFLEEINNVPWHLVENCENIDDSVYTWNQLFLGVADTHAPTKRRRVSGVRSPWMTSKISETMRDRDYHHRKAVKSNSPYHWRMFRKLRNSVNFQIKQSKSSYYIDLIEDSKGEPRKLWKAVNEVSCRKNETSTPNCIISDGVKYMDTRSIATMLNKHFASIGQFLAGKLPKLLSSGITSTPNIMDGHCSAGFSLQPIEESFVVAQLKSLKTNKSIGLDKISARLLKDAVSAISPSLTKLFNLSINLHSFPSVWKCSKVIALFKSGNRDDPSNYRPISILPTISKILEKAVHIQFYEYLHVNNLLSDKQHGFRPHHSTVSALSHFADEILCNMDKGKLCGAVFLDLSKAFDTINHHTLLTKLSSVGVCNDDLAWFKSYLSSRLLSTSCGLELSDTLECNLGVPQGSILGPLLFIVYINDLPNCVPDAQVSIYADDTVLYRFSSSSSDLEANLNADLQKIGDWLINNQLTLNTSKTKVMLIGSSRKLCKIDSISIQVYDSAVERVEDFKYLGVTFSSDMTWSDHIDDLSAKVNKRLGLLKRIKHLLPRFARLLYFNTLILPLLNYADIIWGDKNNSTIMQSLQILQNKAAKVILDLPVHSSATDALHTLNWIKLDRRRQYHRSLYIFKCKNNLLSSHLSLLKSYDVHRYNTRNSQNFRLPAVMTNWGKQRLGYQAVKEWNALPLYIRNCTSIDTFKSLFFAM